MKKYRRTLPLLVLLMMLGGCASTPETMETEPIQATVSAPAERPPTEEARLPVTEETSPVRDSVEETEDASVIQSTPPEETEPPRSEHQPDETTPPETQPPRKEKPENRDPTEPVTEPPETRPKETVPPETRPREPKSTEPPQEEPTKATTPTELPEKTEEEEPEEVNYSYAYKREVASYAAKYLNQYRGSPCTVLPGMSQVAQYRADQLTRNFAHSTSDKRKALAYYEYGRWIDATLAGLEESDSYYESDTTEAICRYFHGDSPEELGKAIADLIYHSSSHWRYVGDSEYGYMGVGVEYRDGWYACVMVGTVNYG